MEVKEQYPVNKPKELLHNQVKELRCSNIALLVENDMFEHFIGRLDPGNLESKAGGEGLQLTQGSTMDGRGAERRQRPQYNLSEPLQLLTLGQKLYVTQREATETQADQEKLKAHYERILDNYKSFIKEADLRSTEIKKAKRDFERRFLKPMKGSFLEVKEPEKVLQHIEDKSKVTQLERFHQKNQALRVQVMKLLQQLQQKKEMRKAEFVVEEEIFFQEYDEPRMDKSLNELKHNSSKVQRLLSSHKEKLQSSTLESTELSKEITKRKELLAKLEDQIKRAKKKSLKAEGLNQFLCRELTDYHAPDITEYFFTKEKHKKLLQSIHHWERKVGIAEMALKTHSREWRRQRGTLTPSNSAEAGSRKRRDLLQEVRTHGKQNTYQG
ncbi:coiled-coil domain-containing protein 113 isoform X2 [Xiphophorus maculatus]|uniref:coiled-coil domain-containing protein 113 isoform X2 n=1 Tax=Xiphophorus maculatus TaxID=8083 RepID=UPI000C6D4AD6|nr:coiled-coil domain-containing protein 113 isoform X2 [Xiphophorus maculatus]